MHYDIKRLALIYSIQAEVEGMKAENENRKQRGESMTYSDEDFNSKSQELQNLAYCPNEVL